MVRTIVFLVMVLGVTFSSLSQCKPKKIETDSCGTVVVLTLDQFTEFYVAKRDLEELSKEYPDLKRKLRKAEKNFRKESELKEIKIKVTEKTLQQVKNSLAELELENLKVKNELGKKKESNIKLWSANVVQGAIILITLIVIIAK